MRKILFLVFSVLLSLLLSPWLVYHYKKSKREGELSREELLKEISVEIEKYDWTGWEVSIRALDVFEAAMSNRGMSAISLCNIMTKHVVISPAGIISGYLAMRGLFGYRYCIKNIVRHENRHVQQCRIIPEGYVAAHCANVLAVRNVLEWDAELYGMGLELPLSLVKCGFILQVFGFSAFIRAGKYFR